MKILHLIGGGDVGGAKTHVLSLVKELAGSIDVKIISFRPGVFTDEARTMGINIEVIRTRNIILDIKRVIEVVRTENYRILHSHGAKANMIAIIVKYFTHIPVVTTIHSDYRLDYMESLYKKLSFGLINSIALRFINYHIGVSDSYRNMLIERRFDPDRIFTVYNGIDFNNPVQDCPRAIFRKKYGLALKDDSIIVGILCRFVPVKGLDIFLQAAKEVLNKNPSVIFLIGGDGPERKNLERKASSLGLTGNVFFIGWVNEPYEFMSNVDIFVLSSLSESFPYVILESTKLKKAVVSSDVGGVSDLIESGRNGYLFDVGNFVQLAEHVLLLVENDVLRKEMGERIYEKARSQFSLENMYKTQMDIYRKILRSSLKTDRPAAKTRGSRYDAIISGWYGVRNIGDDAILKAVVSNLTFYKKDIKIMVLSRNPAETRRIYKVDSINRLNLIKIMRTMKKTRLLIYGGGTLIQDSTSSRSLLYYLAIIWIAKKMGLKVMLYANGIEPINRRINRKLTKMIVNLVEVITLREELSMQELEKLSVDRPRIIITADAALTVEPAEDSRIDRVFTKEGIGLNGPFAGFSIRKWQGYERRYEKIIANTADYMYDRYGLKPVFIPMQYPEDLSVIQSIVSMMKNKGYVIKNRYNESQVIGIVKRMEILIGMRLHSLIFATGFGIPVIGLVYTAKIEGFLRYIHQENASAGHVKKLQYGRLISLVDDIWNRRDEIRCQLESVTGQLKEKALENARIAVELIEEKQPE